ncbi:hypothetical protein L596_024442 [Steinernema carpocapsae]|uniref:Uncharacterized protein n=1 Tax=Steinernema carpocapsae TaxID=34508 RepID=A0A4U5MGP9_STECR|nr:hypothetical protein L596_024442 [Steinernema carpocapsae]
MLSKSSDSGLKSLRSAPSDLHSSDARGLLSSADAAVVLDQLGTAHAPPGRRSCISWTIFLLYDRRTKETSRWQGRSLHRGRASEHREHVLRKLAPPGARQFPGVHQMARESRLQIRPCRESAILVYFTENSLWVELQ